MTARHDHGTVPAIHRQAHQVREQFLRAGGYREVDPIARHHFRDLLGGALMQMQADFRIFAPELANDLRQHIACLRMRGGDRQGAAVALRNSAEVRRMFCISRNMLLAREMISLTRGGGARERSSFALEQLEPEFLLEQLELAADAGLRSMQLPGGGSDVQAVFMNGDQVAQLLKFHGGAGLIVGTVPEAYIAPRITNRHLLMPQSSFGEARRHPIVVPVHGARRSI